MRKLTLTIAAGMALSVALASSASALPADTAQVTAGTDGKVNAVVQVGETIYIGGEFSTVGGEPRARLAAIDATTGGVTAWNPGADGNVYAMATGPDGSIYVGGNFKSIGGVTQKGLVKFDSATGAMVNGWSPKVTGGSVKSIAVGNGVLYVGGTFTKVATLVRNRAASVDLTAGALQAWNPNSNGAVEALGVAPDGAVFAGGLFSSIGGTARQYLARLDGTTGQFLPYPATTIRYPVMELVLTGGRLYLAGAGTGGTIAAHSDTTGALLWTHHATGDVHGLDVSSTTVYAGGHFNYVDGGFRRKLVAFDAPTGAMLGWDPTTSGPFGVAVIEVTESALLVGGEFTKAGRKPQAGFARFLGSP